MMDLSSLAVEEYVDPMLDHLGDSLIAPVDLMQLGGALLSWAVAVERMGHASPASTLDYMDATNGAAGFVRDFVAWASGRLDEEGKQRMQTFLEHTRWEAHLLSEVQP